MPLRDSQVLAGLRLGDSGCRLWAIGLSSDLSRTLMDYNILAVLMLEVACVFLTGPRIAAPTLPVVCQTAESVGRRGPRDACEVPRCLHVLVRCKMT
jgi:hypothetical protein